MLNRLLPNNPAFDPLLAGMAALLLLLILWSLLLSVRFRALGRCYRALLDASGEGRLESLLRDILETTRRSEDWARVATDLAQSLTETVRRSVQRTGCVRFDAFDDVGGRQSFSLALLDAEGTGFLLSGVHGRDGCRVYAKPLTEGASAVPLSDEEREALLLAMKAPVPHSQEAP